MFPQWKFSMVKILETAKVNRDMTNSRLQARRWDEVATIAHEALGEPSLAELEKLKREMLRG